MLRPFTELGKLLDQLARSRDVRVRGPRRSTEHVRENTSKGPGRSAWGQSLYGNITPTPNTMRLFGEAFELAEDEATVIA
jgi:hypothetical protein